MFYCVKGVTNFFGLIYRSWFISYHCLKFKSSILIENPDKCNKANVMRKQEKEVNFDVHFLFLHFSNVSLIR
jgi:hypothetical protein